MKALIMGGDRHGEWVELDEGSAAFFDLRHAATYPIRAIWWTMPGAEGEPARLWKVYIAVHPDLTVRGRRFEQDQTQGALFRMTMTFWMEEYGELQPVDESQLVPDSPSPLFGPDGKPLPAAIHEPSEGTD
jgi:hypothetical protein